MARLRRAFQLSIIPKAKTNLAKSMEKKATGSPAASQVIKPTASQRWAFWRSTNNSGSADSLVIPSFDSVPWPSTTERLLQLLKLPKDVKRTRKASIKYAVVIGVHGYFPARITRAVLGEPTGTSRKFASEAAKTIRSEYPHTHVDEIALEGEGRIQNRINTLYIQLKTHAEKLENADMVLFAVHSQGAVVSLSLIAQLIEQELINPRSQRVTVLSMAGTMLGPMPGMDQTVAMKAISRIEHDSLAELFELQRSDTLASTSLRNALNTVLYNNVKLVLVGSADDQLVPLYSALAVHLRHPNVYRAVYLDGIDVQPEVIEPLLQLATRKLNKGTTDFGIIKELSSVLAGQLVSGGHSKLYSHSEVYKLAIQFTLETSTCQATEPQFLDHDIKDAITRNPYILPSAASVLIENVKKGDELRPFVDRLVEQIRVWKPEKKQLKDLKYRLSGIDVAYRSKL